MFTPELTLFFCFCSVLYKSRDENTAPPQTIPGDTTLSAVALSTVTIPVLSREKIRVNYVSFTRNLMLFSQLTLIKTYI